MSEQEPIKKTKDQLVEQNKEETPYEQAFKKIILALEDKARIKGVAANAEMEQFPFNSDDPEEEGNEFLLRVNPTHIDNNGRILVTNIDLIELLHTETDSSSIAPVLIKSWCALTRWGSQPEIIIDAAIGLKGSGNVDITQILTPLTEQLEIDNMQRSVQKTNGGSFNFFRPTQTRIN